MALLEPALLEPALLEPKAMVRLESMAVKAKCIVEGALTGMHRARLRGSSVEFAEHKEYSRGDEIRHIDWKVLGKADRYYVKQFEQESEMTCTLVVDASGSMSYQGSSVSKQAYACHLAAALAYLLIGQQDRVGLRVFGESETDRIAPPRAKPTHLRTILSILNEVASGSSSGEGSLASALERVAEQARRRRGLVVVISDLFDTQGKAISVMQHLRTRGHDTVLFHILDRDEIDFPFDGLSIFKSLEKDDKVLVDPASIRGLYKKRIQGFIQNAREESLKSGVEYHLAITDQPFETTLMNFLAERLGKASAKADTK